LIATLLMRAPGAARAASTAVVAGDSA